VKFSLRLSLHGYYFCTFLFRGTKMKYDLEICMLSLFRLYQRCILFIIFLSSLLFKMSVGFIGLLGIKLSLQLWAWD